MPGGAPPPQVHLASRVLSEVEGAANIDEMVRLLCCGVSDLVASATHMEAQARVALLRKVGRVWEEGGGDRAERGGRQPGGVGGVGAHMP